METLNFTIESLCFFIGKLLENQGDFHWKTAAFAGLLHRMLIKFRVTVREG